MAKSEVLAEPRRGKPWWHAWLPGLGPLQSVDDPDLIEEYHKSFVSRFVLPSMGLMSVLYYATYFSFERPKLIVLGFCLLVIAGNIYVTTKNRILRFGPWLVKTRSNDLFDAVRWLFNLLIADVALAVTFHPAPAAFVVAWLVIVLSAQADTFKRIHRLPVVAVGLITGGVLYGYLYPETPPAEFLLITCCMAAITLMAAVTESYWIQEIAAKKDARRRSEVAELQAGQLKREALVGSQVRTISHELGNILGVIDMASSDIQENQIDAQTLDILRRSLVHAKKISNLILSDVNDSRAPRAYPVADFATDLELLLAKEVRSRGLTWELHLDPLAALDQIKEQGGGSYFIVHNLVKNAWEAFSAKAGRRAEGRIKVAISRAAGGVVVSVEDNAGGMPEELRLAILGGRAATTKADGHGLGLKFVLEECRSNGFVLDLSVQPEIGTRFALTLPCI